MSIVSPAGSDGPEPLVTAQYLAGLYGTHEEWWLSRARLGLCPHKRLGRSVRFRVSEVADWIDSEQAKTTVGR
jgi:hypothetical protein